MGGVFLCGLIISAVIFRILEEQERQLIQSQFGHLAGRRLEAIEGSLARRLAALDWISEFYASSREVEPREFMTFTRLALSHYADLDFLGWMPRVTAAERPAHEDAMRREGHVDYRIHGVPPQDGPMQAGRQEISFPLAYLQPSAKYDYLFGYDLASRPEIRAAIDRTWKSRRRTLVIAALPDGRGGLSVKLCLLKFVRTAKPSAEDPAPSPRDREGVILGVVDLQLMVEHTLKEFQPEGVDIDLFEETAPGQFRLIASRPSSLRNLPKPGQQALSKEPGGIYFDSSLAAADRAWRAYCRPTDVFLQSQETSAPWTALAFGIVATVLITAYLSLLLGWYRQAEALVHQRTVELLKEQQLLRHLLDLQERDRKLTAFEIHDGLAQLITGATMKLQALEAGEKPLPPAAAELLREALQLIGEGSREARRLIGGLQPPMLDELGIVPALDYLVEELRRRHAAEIEIRSELSLPRLASPLESALFRIAQESLHNAIRHSGSERILVELRSSGDLVRLSVRDWGAGFDPQAVGGDHFGLRGIRERARLLGGRATIDSQPGQGTTITVELPLEVQFGDENGD